MIIDSNLSYSEACTLVKELRDNQIEANIMSGGIRVSFNEDNLEVAQEIVAKYGQRIENRSETTLMGMTLNN